MDPFSTMDGIVRVVLVSTEFHHLAGVALASTPILWQLIFNDSGGEVNVSYVEARL